MENGGVALHIVMLPWLALGHLLPFFELSKRIAGRGHRVSFLSTPRNIRRLPEVPPRLTPLLHLVQLPLPHVDNLPTDAEATVDLPSQQLRPYLRVAFDKLEDQLRQFLEEAHSPPVNWIVFDYSPYWVPRVAASYGVPCAFLGLFSASALCFYGPPSALMGDGEDSRTTPEAFMVPPKWIPFPSTVVLRGYETRELFQAGGVEVDASGVSETHRFGAAIGGCQLVAIRSCPELEPNWLSLLGDLYQKPVLPVGLLPPLVDEDINTDGNCRSRWRGLFEWLDKRQPGSVVYVAFGTEVKLSCGQVHEIALGLEKSRLPFVWALRKPFDEPDELKMLPRGFEERIKDRGMAFVGWLPQVRILAHPSVAGFLTHAGWNSIVEGLALGRALVLLPIMFDQGLNARDLVERGIGVEVPRNEDDGSFTGDAISKTLRLAMVGEDGEPLRARASESKALFGNREVQDEYVNHLVQYLTDHRHHPRVPKNST